MLRLDSTIFHRATVAVDFPSNSRMMSPQHLRDESSRTIFTQLARDDLSLFEPQWLVPAHTPFLSIDATKILSWRRYDRLTPPRVLFPFPSLPWPRLMGDN